MDNSLVGTIDEIVDNILTLHGYASGKRGQKLFHNERIKKGRNFVVLLQDDKHLFSPSKFSGYKNNTTKHLKLKGRHGGKTNERITKLLGKPAKKGDGGYKKIDKEFVEYCKKFDIVPSNYTQPRRYWYISNGLCYPDDVRSTDKIIEGARLKIFVNRYERSSRARRECVGHYGYACSVCGFDFQKKYGQLGKDYIHVHHIIPLSEIKEGYEVDPIKDLRPVCPNCHSMLHREGKTQEIDELKKKLR